MDRIRDNLSKASPFDVKHSEITHQKDIHKLTDGEPKDRVEIASGKTQEKLISYVKDEFASKTPVSEKELTVLFYMHGQYDDIGTKTAAAMIDLERAGSDENVNIVAQLGRNPYKPKDPDEFHVPIDGDWVGVRRYEIRKDSHEDLNIPLSEWHKLESELPNNPILYYCLGDEYWSMGDKEKAFKYYDKSKELGMLKYMEDYHSEESKKVRKEFNDKTRYLDEAIMDKKVFKSEMLQDLGDIKMKEPATLKDFISWGMQKYPAKHYVVVIMGHGGAWMGAAEMSPAKMGEAIVAGAREANEKTGRSDKIDNLVFNSCYMGSVEAAVQMKDAADISLVSENYATTGIFDDWSSIITGIQKNIKEGEPFNGLKFANDMVEMYRAKGKEVKENFPEFFKWKRDYLTLSAIDNKKLNALVDAWKSFNETCKKEGITDRQLFSAVAKAKDYASNAYNPRQVFGFYDQIRDLGCIMDQIKESSDIPDPVKKAADEVKTSLNNAVINEQHEGIGMEGSQGLTIWGPTNAVDVLFMKQEYDNDVAAFAKQTGWSDRLQEAVNNVPKPVLNNFSDTLKNIREIKKQLAQEGLSEAQKKELEEKLNKEMDRLLELKAQMDFTLERKEGIYKDHRGNYRLNMTEFGNLIDEFKQSAKNKNRMSIKD